MTGSDESTQDPGAVELAPLSPLQALRRRLELGRFNDLTQDDVDGVIARIRARAPRD